MNTTETTKEVWKDVAGYNGKYRVSNLGRIKTNNLNKQYLIVNWGA